tara:strand:- start:2393 stop:3085 length:693 start_codon:yes stop_codon:yes gene_type:complete
MANWRQKVVDWDHKNVDWGGDEQILKSSKDAQSNIKNLSLYGEGGCILDLGSNIGEFAKSASSCFDKVVCYEAHPISYEVSVARLANLKNVFINNKAVWKNSDDVLFASTPENSTGVTVRDKKFYSGRKDGYYKTVKSVCFNSIMKEHSPRVIKIDIEGCEYEILNSAEFNDCLEYVSVEFHQPFVSQGRLDSFNMCIKNFKDYGFSIINDVNLKPRKLLYFIILFQRQK